MHPQNRNTATDVENNLMVTGVKGWGEGLTARFGWTYT